MITKEKAVVLSCEDPTPIAFLNVYEEGDVWIKVKGCDTCPRESRLYCCGNCAMLLRDKGECRLHLGNDRRDKPYHCAVYPTPEVCNAWCNLEFECIVGSKKGMIRRVRDKRNEFISKST